MGSKKNWNRPWNTKEIIEDAGNWSLAGDVALLNTIKQFANDLLTKTDHLCENINDHLSDLNEIGLQLDLSLNEFQSLKNSQFIESRVYDDDETLDSKGNDKVLEKNSNQLEEETQIDTNLTLEVKLLDTYFEIVEISVSDSEDESQKSFFLKPIDVYTERPLPPLIGSEEWYTNWYLEDEISDRDSEKSEEVYSDSDNDNNLPKDLLFTSETSSEDFSHTTSENKTIPNSTFKNNTKIPESTISSEGSEDSSYLPTKVPISNKIFVEQLTAKLDNVIGRDENISEEINSKPIEPFRNNAFSGLFADEPPPLSVSDTGKGVFAKGNNLFDEDMLFGDDNKKINVLPQILHEDKNQIFSDTVTTNNLFSQSSKVSKGLFDSDDSDDEIVSRSQNKQNTFLQPHKSIVPLIDDEPPVINVSKNIEPSTKKKPVGGVSAFGSENIGEIIKRTLKNNSESPEKSSEYDKPKEIVSQNIINLFEDNDEDLFTVIDTKPMIKKYSLFDEINEENENKPNSEISQKKKNILSLFDDDDDESEKEDDLFNVPKKNREKRFDLFSDNRFGDSPMTDDNKIILNKKSFGDSEDKLDSKKTVNVDGSIKDAACTPISSKLDISNEEIANIPIEFEDHSSKFGLIGKDKQSPLKPKLTSLFDDNEDDEDDIFANVTKKIDFKLFEEPNSSNNLFSIKEGFKTENSIKTAHIEKTDDYLKNKFHEIIENKNEEANNISIPDYFSKSPPGKMDNKTKDSEISYVLEGSNTISKNINVSLFHNNIDEDDLFLSHEKLDDENNVIKEVTRAETSKKPPISQKPLELNSTTTKEIENASSNKNTEDTSEIKIISLDTVPVSKTQIPSTAPISNHTIYESKSETPIAKDCRPAVCLFGSTPPPDDYTWDNKSDTMSDTEDFLGYRIDQNSMIRSSFFDNEPPSLNEDESSEIVRDLSNTSRIDTNDLMFDPHDSSSRRLSSDIFSEQDGLFVTKSRSMDSMNCSHFLSNTEDSKMSERIDDSPIKNQDSKNIGQPETKMENKTKPVDQYEGKRLKKIASITEMLKSQNQKEIIENKVSPGKLKQNLNINVDALLPGSAQQKIKGLIKSQSLDFTGDDIWNETADDSSLIENKSGSTKDTTIVDSEQALGFDETDQVEVLHSITKGRVRNTTKRRPPSRRGRQEAIRKSAHEFSSGDILKASGDLKYPRQKYIIVPDSTDGKTSVEKQRIVDVSIKNNFSEDADKATPFESPLDIAVGYKNKEVEQYTKTNLFNSSSESDGDLFGSQTNKKESAKTTKKSPYPISSNPKSAQKKSLFDDNSSDDDLFLETTSSKNNKRVNETKVIEKKISTVKKLENVETEEDPLSNLLK